MDDEDFEMVMENSDSASRVVYREEAKYIEEVRKGIIEVSGKEDSYDIFICYKETDEYGNRTIDSVIVQDVYDVLTEKGYRVFFSRISLESKLGVEYEPYIFAALNSAKIMLAFGTSYDYYNAVWVKNEWSRYLRIMAKDKTKYLIPCFKNVDAYDIPKEFAKLQSQDMGKVGAVQDLLRGIEKILPKDVQKEEKQFAVTVLQTDAPGVASLIKRGHLFLEDGVWKSAYEYFDKVLDIDPENAEAYFGQLLAIRMVHNRDELVKQEKSFEKETLYQKALRFADADFRAPLVELSDIVEEKLRLGLERLPQYRKRIALATNCIAAANGCIVGLRSNGTVISTDKNYDISDWRDIVAIAVCDTHIVGLKSDGSVVAVGNNNCGQCNVSGWRDIVAVAVGCTCTVGLKSDGSVVAVGYNIYIDNISDWRDIVAITAGDYHVIGLKSDGSVVATGGNDEGRCNVSDWKNIVAIAANTYYTVGLKNDGSVVTTHWACNVSGWRDIVAIFASGAYIVGLKRDGNVVVATYRNAYGECNVSDWKNIATIAVGEFLTVGLKSDGSVVAVGNNEYGQCDVVSSWRDIVAIATSTWQTVGLKSDGSVVAVGRNDYGQCDVSGWRLFQSLDTLEQKQKEIREQKEREKHQQEVREATEKAHKEELRREEERIVAEIRREEERVQAELRRKRIDALTKERTDLQAVLVTLKGLFTGKRRKEINTRLMWIESEIDKNSDV